MGEGVGNRGKWGGGGEDGERGKGGSKAGTAETEAPGGRGRFEAGQREAARGKEDDRKSAKPPVAKSETVLEKRLELSSFDKTKSSFSGGSSCTGDNITGGIVFVFFFFFFFLLGIVGEFIEDGGASSRRRALGVNAWTEVIEAIAAGGAESIPTAVDSMLSLQESQGPTSSFSLRAENELCVRTEGVHAG